VGTFDAQAPISKWNKISFYSSSAACQADREILIKETAPCATPEVAKFFQTTQCVAEDDARFK